MGSIWLAIVAAAGAAVSFALTGILQHRATALVPRRGAMHPSLLYHLAHQPLWLVSIGAALTGFALQAAALRLGPLALVQPILAMQILAAPVLAAAAYHRRLDRELLLGAGLSLVGLSAFLVAGNPSSGPAAAMSGRDPATSSPSVGTLLVVILVVVLVAAVIRPLVSHRRGWSRALTLALGAGVLYGVTAGLLKVTVEHSQQGWAGPLTSWTLYALLIAGPAGFLLNQNAFQAGPFVAPLAVIMVTDPLVAVSIGLVWLNEQLNAAPWAIATQLVGLAVMATGIIVLAHRSRTAGRSGTPPSDQAPAPVSAPNPCACCT